MQTHFAAAGVNVGAVAAKEEVWEVSAQLGGYALSVLLLQQLQDAGEHKGVTSTRGGGQWRDWSWGGWGLQTAANLLCVTIGDNNPLSVRLTQQHQQQHHNNTVSLETILLLCCATHSYLHYLCCCVVLCVNRSLADSCWHMGAGPGGARGL